MRPALISGFRSMKRLGVFILPPGWDASPSPGYPQHFAGTHLYTWVERGTVRVKCLAQEHNTIGSLSTRVCETRMATRRGHFSYQDGGVSQIFIWIISNGEKILSNVNVVVWRQIKRENSSLPVAVRISKTCMLKLPNVPQPGPEPGPLDPGVKYSNHEATAPPTIIITNHH